MTKAFEARRFKGFLSKYHYPLDPTVETFKQFVDLYIPYGEYIGNFTPAFAFILRCHRIIYRTMDGKDQKVLGEYIESLGGIKNFGVLLDTIQQELLKRLDAQKQNTSSGRGEDQDGSLVSEPGLN